MRWIVPFLFPLAAAAGDFTPMTGTQIEAALTDTTLAYGDKVKQRFYASGRTLYEDGRPSWGRWAVRGDQYCSQWPPAGEWSCYDMDTDGTTLRFISETGHVTAGGRVAQD